MARLLGAEPLPEAPTAIRTAPGPNLLILLFAPEPLPPDLPPTGRPSGRWLAWLLAAEPLDP